MSRHSFKDEVVVITGASAGIGRAIALELADQGARLVLAARSEERLDQLAGECRARGAKALIVVTDVAEKQQCEALIAKTLEAFGRIDTLINNAGITMWARFDEIQDMDMLERIMQVNYFGSVYCSHYALPHLKASRGRIVAVSSTSGKAGVPTRTGYCASKHAMAGFFDALRVELAGSGVSVTSVYPGFVSTEIRERAYGPDGQPLGVSPVHEDQVMSAKTCADLIIKAAGKRQRELVMTLRGKLGVWVKLIAPGLVDYIARKAIQDGR